jgi:hypothetical protein
LTALADLDLATSDAARAEPAHFRSRTDKARAVGACAVPQAWTTRRRSRRRRRPTAAATPIRQAGPRGIELFGSTQWNESTA